MKKTFAKILVLVLIVSMLAGMVACGTPAETTDPSPAVEDNTPEIQQPDEVAETETLTIGLLLNVTGWFAAYDLHALYEVDAIMGAINDMGGWEIGGTKYKLEYVLSDLQSDFGNINAAAMYLIDQGVDIVLETNDFFVAGAQPLFEQHGIMHINKATTMDPSWGGPDNPHAFTAGTNGTYMQWLDALEMTVEYFPDAKKLVYVENDTGNNQGNYDHIVAQAGNYGLEIVDGMILYPGQDPDMAAIALQIVSSGADSVICAGAVNNTAALLKEIRNLGSDMPVVSSSSLFASDIIAIAGEDVAYNIATTANSRAPEDNEEIYNLTYNKMVEQIGEEAAASFNGVSANIIYVLLNVMSIAGTTDVDAVMETWVAQETIPTIFGLGYMGGEELYGLKNHAVGSPAGRMLMTKEGTTYNRVEIRVP